MYETGETADKIVEDEHLWAYDFRQNVYLAECLAKEIKKWKPTA